MMRIFFCLFFSGLLLSFGAMASNINVNMTANLVSTSCRISFDDSGNLDLGTVDFDYLNNNTSVDKVYSGGQSFYITVSDCAQVAGKNPSRLTVSFTPLAGTLAATNLQVFANQFAQGGKKRWRCDFIDSERTKHFQRPGYPRFTAKYLPGHAR